MEETSFIDSNTCSQCGKICKDKRGLALHKKKCEGVISLDCKFCDQTFANPYSLEVHNTRCKAIKSYKETMLKQEIVSLQTEIQQFKSNWSNISAIQKEANDEIMKLQYSKMEMDLKHQDVVNRLNQQINTLQRQNSLLNKENDYLKVLVENIGETEIINKTNDTDDFSISENTESNHLEYVYIIQEREFVKEGRPLYKIGRTRQEPNKRHVSYPKDSALFMMLSVPNCQNAERAIKSLFKKKFKQDRSIGVEYFEGNVEEMKKEYIKLLS